MDELGCSSTDLRPGQTLVTEHGKLAGYSGIKIFRRNGSCIISAPETLKDRLQTSYESFSPDQIFSRSFAEQILPGSTERVIGPAWIGGVDRKSLLPIEDPKTVELPSAQQDTFKMFLRDCSQAEVNDSGLEAAQEKIVVLLKDGMIVAASGYQVRENILAHIGVLIHPLYRGNGYARLVICHVVKLAMEAGLGIQYQTLLENKPSVKAAMSLGFSEFAQTIAVRIKS